MEAMGSKPFGVRRNWLVQICERERLRFAAWKELNGAGHRSFFYGSVNMMDWVQ